MEVWQFSGGIELAKFGNAIEFMLTAVHDLKIAQSEPANVIYFLVT